MEFRTALLTIDRNNMLPLMYEYDSGTRGFSTVGYVRLGSAMLPQVTHNGPDNTTTRDQFLVKVLVGVLVPQRRAQKIVRAAEHDPDRPTPPG